MRALSSQVVIVASSYSLLGGAELLGGASRVAACAPPWHHAHAHGRAGACRAAALPTPSAHVHCAGADLAPVAMRSPSELLLSFPQQGWRGPLRAGPMPQLCLATW